MERLEKELYNILLNSEQGQRALAMNYDILHSGMSYFFDIPKSNEYYKDWGIRQVQFNFCGRYSVDYGRELMLTQPHQIFVDLNALRCSHILNLEMPNYDVIVKWKGSIQKGSLHNNLNYIRNAQYLLDLDKEIFDGIGTVYFNGYKEFKSIINSKAHLRCNNVRYQIELMEIDEAELLDYINTITSLKRTYFGRQYSFKESRLVIVVRMFDEISNNIAYNKLKRLCGYLAKIIQYKGENSVGFGGIEVQVRGLSLYSTDEPVRLRVWIGDNNFYTYMEDLLNIGYNKFSIVSE